jgi:hypothetical protein
MKDPILDADCSVCGDTGELPILTIDDGPDVEVTDTVPCPFCGDDRDGHLCT